VHDIGNVDIAFAIHDGIFSLQYFSVKSVNLGQHSQDDEIANIVIRELKSYERCYLAKFIGAGLPQELKERSPSLPSRLWLDLDVVPILITTVTSNHGDGTNATYRSWWHKKSVDEQANSMVRKCILYAYLRTHMPLLLFMLAREHTAKPFYQAFRAQISPCIKRWPQWQRCGRVWFPSKYRQSQ
jgi:hypothetical protein